MLLSDGDLRELLPQMRFETDEPRRPFQAQEQVQPCSIDLRLDRFFWVPRKPKVQKALDLRKMGAGEIDIRRLFEARRLRAGEGFTLRPGHMVLGRTFEKFTIPNGHAGKLEGRSTYARLGIAVHCTGDFINPSYRGHMPLQLVNHGSVPIVLTPYMSICQLLVMRTSTPSEHPYGEQGLGHKYVDDAGGPSKYWLDKSLAKLNQSFTRVRAPEPIQGRVLEVFGRSAPDVLDRFAEFIQSLRPEEITSEREVLERFADNDTKKYAWAKRRLKFYQWFFLLPVTASMGALFKTPYQTLHFWFWGITVALLPVGVWGMFFAKEPSQPFTETELVEHFSNHS